MSNNASLDKTLLEKAGIDAQDVADYLVAHPDFFLRHKDVLADMQIHHQNQGIVSLTQIQLEQYRDKVKHQKKQLESLIHNAKRNEVIYTTYADLNFAISKCQQLAELESVLQQHLCEKLGMLEVNLVLLNDNERLPELPQKSLLEKKLSNKGYYFGRLGKHEKQMLFNQDELGSVALIRIGDNPAIAVLAIASDDPVHFTPEMDTTLLQYLNEFLAFHLDRILNNSQ
ncbi:DUF484 family protein [Glaciecola sp. 1036]|uniref:DUF484 family protein n=1 Tax=Alteromonadaceae TaxID=72275 RepID=UPI003D07ACFC